MLKKAMSVVLVIVMIVSVFTIVPFTASAEEKSTDYPEYINSTESANNANDSEIVQQTTDNVLKTKTVVGNDTPAKNEKAEIAGNWVGTGLSKADMLSDNLFHNATYYNNDLAVVSANLLCDVEDVSGYFPENHSEQYTWEPDSAAFHVGIGYKTIKTNGSPKNLVVISFRGTGSAIEAVYDFFKDVNHYPYEGQEALFASWNFAVAAESYLNQFFDKHSDVKKLPIVYLVTGYSIGGAGANLLGARLTNRNGGECSDNVFVYTFGAIKAIASESNVKDGFGNIHNIYNYYDSWGPNGNHSVYGVSDPYYKFGNTHFCYFDRDHAAVGLNSHDMGNYRTEVESKKVEVSINRKAGLLNGGQWWTISNRNLNITSWDYLNIYGSGALSDGSLMGMSYPWYGYFEDINMIVLDDRITSIGEFEFSKAEKFKNLYTIHITNSVTSIGNFAFNGCDSLENVYFHGTREQWESIDVDFTAGNYPLQNATLHCIDDEPLSTDNIDQNREVIESGSCGPDLMYVLYADGILEITGNGEMTTHPWTTKSADRISHVVFPDGLTSLCDNSFDNCIALRELSIPQNVKSIGNFAFRNSGLDSLILPNNLETLGYHVLYGNTGVKELVIPGTVTSFRSSTATYYSGADRGVFENSGLEKVIIGDGITSISPMMFCVCKSLREVIIPDSVETIGFQAFDGCSALESINLPNSITKIDYRAFEETGLTTLNLPANITSIGSRVLNDNTGVKYLLLPKTLTSTSIYERLNDGYGMLVGSSVETVEFENGIAIIPEYALKDAASTTTVILPSSVKEIGNFAFQNSGLTSLALPDGVETIGYRVLYGNTGVKELTIPGSVTNFGSSTATYYSGADRGVFENSGLEKVIIGNGITSISPMMFCVCKSLREVIIPNSVETIGFQAFDGCSALESINLPNSITKIDYRAFEETGLTTLNLPANITSIGSRVLNGNTGVKYLLLPKTLTSTSIYERLNDGYGMLVGSSVETVEFEEGIEMIPDNTLLKATSTTSVILPSTLKEIGNSAFENSGLTSLSLPEGLETLGYRVIYGNTGIKELTIPGTVKDMKYNSYYYGGGTFENSGLEKVIIQEGVTEISSMAFENSTSLREIFIPSTVTAIGDDAFIKCSALESIDLPDSITRIGNRAFQNTGLKELTLPESITSIGSGFLDGNTGVSYLKIPKSFISAGSRYSSSDYGMFEGSAVATVEFEDGIEIIPEKSLYRAKNTTEVILPSSVKTIETSAFELSGLTSLTLPEGLETIGYRVIYGNTGIKELTIPGTVKDMKYNSYYYGGGTFENSGLEKVIILDGVTEISSMAFEICTSLREVIIPNTVTEIGDDSFIRCSALESIDLPDSITRIGNRAFQNTGLTELTLPESITSIGSGFLDGNTGVSYLKIPKSFISAGSRYSSSDYGMLEGSAVATVEFEDGIETIPEKSLFRARNTTKVILPSSVKTIETSAFELSGLTSLTLPEGLETIGYRVIYGNTGIKELTIPGTVKDMKYNSYYYGGGTFENSGLEKVAIEEGGASITSLAFCNCNSLREITIPFSVNAIGSDAFINCSDLTVTGYTGSYAETFALDNNIRFVSLGEYIPPTEPLSDLVGDVDSDGRVTITDVTSIQRYLAELESLTEEQLALADTNGDGEINIADATHVQMYLAEYDGIVLGKQLTA